jgi:apolipoprotein N-acyltransferase
VAREENSYINFRIRKKPWYAWLFWIGWVIWLLFWLEVSIGSYKEIEYRASYISLAVFILSLAVGFIIWLRGYIRFKKIQS